MEKDLNTERFIQEICFPLLLGNVSLHLFYKLFQQLIFIQVDAERFTQCCPILLAVDCDGAAAARQRLRERKRK